MDDSENEYRQTRQSRLPNKPQLFFGLALLVLIVVGAGFLYQRRQEAFAQRQMATQQDIQAERASLSKLRQIISSANSASVTLNDALDRLEALNSQGSTAGQQRHDDSVSGQPDMAAEFQEANTELDAVNSFPAEISTIEASCTALADVLRTSESDDENDLRNNCRQSVASFRKSQNDWWRAIYTIQQNLQARVDMRYYAIENTDVLPYYQSSSNAWADAITAIHAAMDDVHRLTGHVQAGIVNKEKQLASLEASLGESEQTIAAVPTTHSTAPTAVPMVGVTMADVTPRPAVRAAARGSQLPLNGGPLPSSEVLPLLRATPALTVSSNPDGHTAYVTVPDTPASGTADANRTVSGRLADGRWVVFIPLASGSASTGDIYSLMWVWTSGQAQFVGEIPAENNGLGQLSTRVRDGEIYVSWPTCCPRATRTKLLTLDGIRLRLLSDTTS